MKKQNLWMVVILLFGLGLGMSGVEAGPEKIPALAEVSTKLPEAEQEAYRQKKIKLEEALKGFIEASERFNHKPTKNQSDEEYATLTAERAQRIAAAQKYNAEMASHVKAMETGDSMLVDARNVPSELSKSVENAIAGAYSDAPPGVSDRVRKGFQAVAARDWKVAKAWFEDALQRDPDNARLKRLVVLASATPELKSQTPPSTAGQRGSLEKPNPGDIRFLFPGLQALDEAEAMELLFGLPRAR